jgi:hypothetical protein
MQLPQPLTDLRRYFTKRCGGHHSGGMNERMGHRQGIEHITQRRAVAEIDTDTVKVCVVARDL